MESRSYKLECRRSVVDHGKKMECSGANRAEEGGFLARFLTGFLLLSVWVLSWDLAGTWNGWQGPNESQNLLHAGYTIWISIRAHYIACPIRALSFLFMAIFVLQSIDKLVLSLGCFWIKSRKIQPEIKRLAGSSRDYPKVLVQIPMCNEREVYQQSISAACTLDWPSDRLLIQILDDSSDESIQSLIREEVLRWNRSGINIVYRHRLMRTGYKAGNLKSAMNCDYTKEYEFVAIFDADFQPSPNYLKRTIPHFKDNPELGLVQARWALVNRDVNLLTRLQYINMCYHFEVEQQVGGAFLNFFGFNGTAGVWRIKALEDSGGWMERTTVEDMDIAVRAHLIGWKFIFLDDVKVLCEVPESYEAYRKQQQRWNSGPVHLFRLCLTDMLKSKLPMWKKANLVMLFFVLRKLIVPCYSFLVLCILLPVTMFVPEAELPLWFVYYVPLLLSILNVLPSKTSFPFLIPYLLFENTMSATKFSSVMAGIFQLGTSYEWVVTKKAGRVAEKQRKVEETRGFDGRNATLPRAGKMKGTIYRRELILGLIMLTAALRSLLSAQRIHFYFLISQGTAFLAVGFGLVGEPIG